MSDAISYTEFRDDDKWDDDTKGTKERDSIDGVPYLFEIILPVVPNGDYLAKAQGTDGSYRTQPCKTEQDAKDWLWDRYNEWLKEKERRSNDDDTQAEQCYE